MTYQIFVKQPNMPVNIININDDNATSEMINKSICAIERVANVIGLDIEIWSAHVTQSVPLLAEMDNSEGRN